MGGGAIRGWESELHSRWPGAASPRLFAIGGTRFRGPAGCGAGLKTGVPLPARHPGCRRPGASASSPQLGRATLFTGR